MKIEERYVLVGTSHVSKDSKIKIKEKFNDFKPDIIAIELDKQRFQALASNQKSSMSPRLILQIGLTGYIFAVIGKLIQNKIGDVVGMNPGAEMMLGAQLARNNKLLLALIDQDVAITLKGLSKRVKFSEKLKIFWDIIASPFAKKEKIKIDVAKIPPNELIVKMLTEMKGRYPGFYKVLLEDRNKVMAKKIYTLLVKHPESKVLAVIGAGHKEGIKDHINKLIASNVY